MAAVNTRFTNHYALLKNSTFNTIARHAVKVPSNTFKLPNLSSTYGMSCCSFANAWAPDCCHKVT